MRIYNETTRTFAVKCLALIRQIIQQETELKMGNSRIHYLTHSYPISIEIFTGEKLGFFNPNYYRIGINHQIMYQAKDKVLKDLLRHEIAHYLTYIFHGVTRPHGPEFQSVCEKYHWPQEVSDTKLDIQKANLYTGNLESERIINKVKNLLKLAESDNVYEAELATVKANKLLLNYNISHLESEQQITIYSDTLIKRARKDAKMECIYKILTHFMVSPIYSYGKGEVCLDVAGTRTNVELANYVANFLDTELERLWQQTKKDHNLKGLRSKNSFYYGVAKGYDQKMQKAHQDFSAEQSKALIKVEGQLEKNVRYFMRLKNSYSYHTQRDHQSSMLGQKAGASLTINKAISKNSHKQIGTSR